MSSACSNPQPFLAFPAVIVVVLLWGAPPGMFQGQEKWLLSAPGFQPGFQNAVPETVKGSSALGGETGKKSTTALARCRRWCTQSMASVHPQPWPPGH
ncbi:hypothetical protein BO71DRAFT_398773 [Aspergillus ellipticus CBS 707.79]|uniref:Uncharacterized protein n=1 Tax=Aspergillus ellipticus CBS 707.79 TaxID=1448320 RepID=A0A319DBM2_9EURO|nr:hypothetical protein BO71DRAFT_398773 [Aspergillus ellipticus CBS 707.79]